MKINIEGRKLRPAFSKEQIKDRIKEMGKEITKDYQGKELVCVGILNGAYVFLADLIRNIDLPLTIDFIRLSSYKGEETTGHVSFSCNLKNPIKNKHVLIVEDIIDTGTTFYKSKIVEKFLEEGALSCKIASFAQKTKSLKYPIKIDYLGFEVDNKYIVGYGFDFNEYFRNTEDIFYLD